MIAIRGMGSNVAKTFIDYAFRSGIPFEIKRDTVPPFNADRYLICQGILYGKRRVDMTSDEVLMTYKVNYVQVARMCDDILEYNDKARICVVGSESGISGSYDEVYADSKRLLHHYVETKEIKKDQQLVCVAPSIIEDTEMTITRKDRDNLDKSRSNHPKGRFLTCHEVASMIYFLLYTDLGYTTNTVIRMNGGLRK